MATNFRRCSGQRRGAARGIVRVVAPRELLELGLQLLDAGLQAAHLVLKLADVTEGGPEGSTNSLVRERPQLLEQRGLAPW